jgi:hypothetical protein
MLGEMADAAAEVAYAGEGGSGEASSGWDALGASGDCRDDLRSFAPDTLAACVLAAC